MTTAELRQALQELNGQRDLEIVLAQIFSPDHTACYVKKAMLLPAEADQLVKVTDGRHIYIIDAERVAWLRI
jgi:hypothetical protein